MCSSALRLASGRLYLCASERESGTEVDPLWHRGRGYHQGSRRDDPFLDEVSQGHSGNPEAPQRKENWMGENKRRGGSSFLQQQYRTFDGRGVRF